jgi:hypothetical protein
LCNRQFNGQQQGQYEYPDPDQPTQPIALIERRLHGIPWRQVSKFLPLLRETLKPVPFESCP